MKGGVGKTTVTMHLAGTFARLEFNKRRKKILAIDYDPQFNLSQAFLPPRIYFGLEKRNKTIMSVLVDSDKNLDPFKIQVPGNESPPSVAELKFNIYNYKDACLDIIPSTLDLMYLALGQPEKKTKPMEERFNKFIAECKSEYDLVFIDCHPAGSLFTKTALQNSNHVIIPVAPERYAIRGIGLMMQFIKAKTIGANIPKPHILFNLADRRGISTIERTIRDDPKFKDYCMGQTLKKYKAFSDPIDGKGFVWSSAKPYSTEAFLNVLKVAREFYDRINE